MNTMRHLFTTLLIRAGVCFGSDEQSTVEQFKMRATVQDVINVGCQPHIMTYQLLAKALSDAGFFTRDDVEAKVIGAPKMRLEGGYAE